MIIIKRIFYFSLFYLVFFLNGCGGGSPAVQNIDPNTDDSGSENSDQINLTPIQGWNTQIQIGNARGSFDYELLSPEVDMNDDGLSVAAWVEEFRGPVSGLPSIWVNVIQNGVMGSPIKITTTTSISPKVSVSNNGDAVVIFTRRSMDGGGIKSTSIWARHYINGAWAATETQISDLPADDYSFYASNPDIGIDQNGNIIAVWMQSDQNAINTLRIIYASHYDGSSWSTPFPVNNATTTVNIPRIAVNDKGVAIIVWPEDTNPYDPSAPTGTNIPNIWARVFINNTWLTPVKIGSAELQSFDSSARQYISINSNGTAIAVWEENKGTDFNIVESRFDSVNKVWSPANKISTSTNNVSLASATLLENGDAAVIWSTTSTAQDGIFRYYDLSSDTWLSSELYEFGTNNVRATKINSDGQNNIYISWLQSVGDTRMSQHIRKYSLMYGWTDYEPVGNGNQSAMSSNFSGELIIININSVGLFNVAAFSTYFMP